MTDLSKRVAALGPKIEKLMGIGGAAGLSLGVLHHGKPIYQASYGFRDIPDKLPVTDETMFPGCSLTKALTAAAVALLVEEEKVTWDTLVKDVLPKFKIKDDILRNYATVADLLCHRSGMSWGDNLYIGSNNNVLISGKNSMKHLNNQARLLPFRGQFNYTTFLTSSPGHLIEKVTGSPWDEVVRCRILEPLDMQRTSLQTPPSDIDKVAKCYNTLGGGTPTSIDSVKTGDDGFGGSSGGIRTCV